MSESNQDLLKLQRAKEAFKNRDYLRAQEIFSEIIESDPSSVEGYFYLANIFHIRGELGKAIKAFTRVLTLDPTHTDAAVSLSVLYNDIGRYEDAKEVYERAQSRVKAPTLEVGLEDEHVKRKFSSKHHELGDLYATYNQFDDALVEYNKALALYPQNLDVRLKLAKLYAKRGFSTKALDELRRLKQEYPDFTEARLALGILHMSVGNVVEAQTEWSKLLAIHPGHEEALMYMRLADSAKETTLS